MLANLSDDAPRLVYADTLSEADDPRGEFIAVQCRLQSGKVRGAAAAELRKREAALLDAHREEWFGPLEKWLRQNDAYGLNQLEVERGFVTQCRVQVVSPGVVSEVFGKAPLLERLIIRGSQFDDEPRLSQLTMLDAEGDAAGSVSDFVSKTTCPSLRRLVLAAPFSSKRQLSLAHQPQLRVLELSSGSASVQSLPARLERLHVTHPHAVPLEGLQNLKSLQLSAASKPHELQAVLGLAPHLERLSLGGSLEALTPVLKARWPVLEHLDLSGVALGPEGGALVAKLRAPALTSLDLTNTRLKPGGAWAVLRSPLMKHLRQVSLRANRLRDEDLQDLRELEHALLLLNLKKNPLSAGFLKKLATAFPHTKLSR